MRLRNSVQKIALEDKLSRLRPFLEQSMRLEGIDPDEYPDVQDLIDTIPGMLSVIVDGDPARFRGGYRLWASVPRIDHPDHWMNSLCSSTDTHMPMTVDELHGREDYKSTVLDHTGSDFLGMIEKHLTLFHHEGLAHIIYTQVDSAVGAGIIQKLQMTHPYTAACSLHEFFKLLLEWQWALLYADNDEPAAQLASDVLDHFELHVDEVDSNEVVRDLMGLPDMQVAQYVKTGECALNQVTPEMPLSFKLWATTNQVMEEPRPILAQLYIDCVSYKNIEKDLGRL
jgi:hypothetical protein